MKEVIEVKGTTMWIKSYSHVFQNVSKEKIWNLWADVNNWHKWDHDIDYAKLEEPFIKGSKFLLKPKGAHKACTISLVDVEEGKKFTDLTKFFGGRMYGTHEMVEEGDGVRLTTTLKVQGILGFLWRKFVAEKIIKTAPQQMEHLVEYARKKSRKKQEEYEKAK